MKLYDSTRAPNPRRVRIFLAEKGIEVPLVPVDILAREMKSDAFTALNPLQRLPVLVFDDGAVISESVAICRYFEELYPEPPLMGATPMEKAVVEMWNRRIEQGIFASVTAAFRHGHPAMAELEVPQVAEWAEVNRPKAVEMMRFLDRELATREFVAGWRFSIADITLLCAMDFCKVARIEVPEELVHLRRWHADVSARQSARMQK